MPQIAAKTTQQQNETVQYDKEAATCPICHHSILALHTGPMTLAVDNEDGGQQLQIAYRCPRPECGHQFIGIYKYSSNVSYTYIKSLPQTPEKASFDDEISELSPTFENIYNQALAAETQGLNEISGVALRKAFEFLIKDYCIKKHPDSEEEIKNIFLGKCIQEYIDDIKIKQCAERATWLGNDETHYVRKWEEHDINDLKILIRLSINWIVNDQLTEKYLTEINHQTTDTGSEKQTKG